MKSIFLLSLIFINISFAQDGQTPEQIAVSKCVKNFEEFSEKEFNFPDEFFSEDINDSEFSLLLGQTFGGLTAITASIKEVCTAHYNTKRYFDFEIKPNL